MTAHIRTYTLPEAIELVRKEPDPIGSSRTDESGWAGATFDDAVRMAEHGYESGAATLRRRLGVVAGVRDNPTMAPTWDVQGSDVDMGRVLSGEPLDMIDMRPARMPTVLQRIAIERCVPGITDTSVIERVGASVYATIAALRASGVAAELWATFTTRASYGATHSIQVLIQDARYPLAESVLAYWLIHPSALRRIAFGIWEHESDEIRNHFRFRIGGGYGTCVTSKTPPEGVYDRFDEVAPANEYHLQGWIEQVLARRGVRVNVTELLGEA